MQKTYTGKDNGTKNRMSRVCSLILNKDSMLQETPIIRNKRNAWENKNKQDGYKCSPIVIAFEWPILGFKILSAFC